MKKTTAKLLCLIMSIVMAIGIFSGCDWITVNTDRDMAQVIATVQISDEVDPEDIYKRQLVSGYVNYGYQYVYYYSYTTAQAYQLVLDNLVNNRIIIQHARVELANTYNGLLSKTDNLTDFETYFKANAKANGTAINPKTGDNQNLELYLTDYEIAQAYYSVRSAVNTMIESYMDEEDDEDEKEDVTYTERTAPAEDEDDDLTESELKEKTPSDEDYEIANLTLKVEGDAYLDALKNTYGNEYDLNMAVWAAYKIDISDAARKKAYGSLLQYLRDQGLITKDETYDYASDSDNVLKYTYFSDSIKSQLESAIVNKYEESLIAGVQAKLSDDAIWEQYLLDYDNQKALYTNDYSSYESALSSASDESFVLFSPFGGYGYVANLLIGFTDEQSNQLSDYSAKANVTQDEIKAYRAELAKQVFAKDQRDSWVYLNYGKYNEDGSFTFDDKYTVSDLANLKNYIGTVTVADPAGYKEEDDNGVTVTKWNVLNAAPTQIAFDTFVAEYLNAIGIENVRFENAINYGVVANFSDETVEQFKDLMYVFTTDPGGLSSEYGYLYSPITSATQYVSEFAAAAKLVVEQGPGAYTMVITDYGIHVILCTKLVSEPYNVETDKAQFIADLADKDTVAYKYRQVKRETVTDNEISKIVNNFINTNREASVKLYESRYSEYMTDSSAS